MGDGGLYKESALYKTLFSKSLRFEPWGIACEVLHKPKSELPNEPLSAAK